MSRQQRWIDYTGLNLIRIVIGSYFMALSLDLIEGSDPRVIFLPFLDPAAADLVTTVFLFSVTVAFMCGLFLRLTSLMLATFTLASSYVTNFMMPETAQIAEFWRDLTLVCAILLCYSCLKRNELRKAALVWRQRSRKPESKDTVVPRRISATAPAKTPRDTPYHTTIAPPMTQPRPVMQDSKRGAVATATLAWVGNDPTDLMDEDPLPKDDDIASDNIFAAN